MVFGLRIDPYLGFNFLVEVDMLLVAGFSEVSGLQSEIQTEEYQEGGRIDYAHKLPGPTRYSQNIILRHGLTEVPLFWIWWQMTSRGIILRRNGTIFLLDRRGVPHWAWHFMGAYPVRWSGPDLRAGSAEVAVETLELAHQGIQALVLPGIPGAGL
jgi:phage tail-like protein